MNPHFPDGAASGLEHDLRGILPRPGQPMSLSPYASSAYAAALEHIGQALSIRPGLHLLERAIPGTENQTDLLGPYPLLDGGALDDSCLDDQLPVGPVSLTAVLDPLSAPEEARVVKLFPDFRKPFKEHSLVDLGEDLGQQRRPQHRRKVRRAHEAVEIVRATPTEEQSEAWVTLYAGLREQHGFHGSLANYSTKSLRAQLHLPGARLYLAHLDGSAVAGSLWFDSDRQTWYHLGASSKEGLAVGASFALFDVALRDAAEVGLEWANLGGGAGLANDAADGLARFKRGWTPHLGWSQVVGRVLDRGAFDELCEARGPCAPGTFPPYRYSQ